MMLKNLMEEKQLDFNAPLLSVRRFASASPSSEGDERKRIVKSQPKIPSLPYYKSELKSGPVSNPGAVPFLWEQIPGRPKDGGGAQPRATERPPVAPKLPPGRVLDVKQQSSNKEPEDQSAIKAQMDNDCPDHKISYLDNNLIALEKSKESLKKKGDADTEEDADEAFTDALETLSRTESFLNCSVTGMSAWDGPNTRSSGTFLTDPQTRDFMLGRFLPAAKAVAAEMPQYASRKQPLPYEQPRETKKVVSGDTRPPQYKYRPNMIQQFPQDEGEEESEDEDEDDYGDTGNLSANACGLFPRFCLKGSFCLLNPVPGMKVRTRVPVSSVRKVGKQVKTTYARSHKESKDEHSWDAVYKHKLASRIQRTGVLEDESKLTSQSNRLTYWSDSQTPDESPPNRISPCRVGTRQSSFREGSGFLGIPEEVKNLKANGIDSHNKDHKSLREILFHQNSQIESGSVSPTVEKTLYVDSVHIVETSNSKSSSPDAKLLMNSSGKDFETLVEGLVVEENLATESYTKNINHLKIPDDKGILEPQIFRAADSDLPTSDRSNLGGNIDRIEGFRQDSVLDQERFVLCPKGLIDEKLDFDNPQPLKSEDKGISYTSSFRSPLAPPLPKSPSESWLSRTLPSIPFRNPSSRYQSTRFNVTKQIPETSVDPKWETIVKSSNVNTGHLWFSEQTGT
ncbi:PREDICTED: uncharacterized protein LOC104611577 isoform X2 [Nelumbo nucifera]|uniref:Uncharacterized protein n=2 Tax=Nelumbo nucifera TaxID=4432 RepID=A0A822XTG2_NELNU|nr:PREDICTED: uncharacterized protein LOC104611577 isoform X2 [Nelumbo nucifera]DAD24904.1 TPA_asm: hypothetical protein HUJ06_026368 [Nelumbo nucifera]